MPVDKKFCCKNTQGEDIYLFTMTNKYGTTVSITNYGAIITSFKIKMDDGSFNDIVLGFDNVEDYLSERYLKNYAYLGAACGRYANRIKNGRFTLDGKEYQLTQNIGHDILHGGKEGIAAGMIGGAQLVLIHGRVTGSSVEMTIKSTDTGIATSLALFLSSAMR